MHMLVCVMVLTSFLCGHQGQVKDAMDHHTAADVRLDRSLKKYLAVQSFLPDGPTYK